jgi:phospholipase A-2-activating protein
MNIRLIFASPPVIDLSRLVSGYCASAFTAPGQKERFFEALFKAADWNSPWTPPLPKYRETNVLLVLRSLANAFQEGAEFTEGNWAKKV